MVNSVGVIGGGTMGSGIAQVAAQAGLRVVLVDLDPDLLRRALGNIQKSLERLEKKGSIDASKKQEALSRIATSTDIKQLRDQPFIIEAVFENLDLKKGIFKELDELCPPSTILATNTSSLPITEIASMTRRPEKVIGTHFMNPVPVMMGVEVIRGRLTSDETVETTRNFIQKLGRKPVLAVDYAGFINSRLLNIYLNEAAYTVMDGNNPKDVDDCMVYTANMPIGPCALMDLVGIDVIVNILGILREEYGEKFKVAPILRQMVRAGQLGKKTGRGFYQY
jgi:3-hydroxybutyryl-CoA dehydrogenase